MFHSWANGELKTKATQRSTEFV